MEADEGSFADSQPYQELVGLDRLFAVADVALEPVAVLLGRDVVVEDARLAGVVDAGVRLVGFVDENRGRAPRSVLRTASLFFQVLKMMSPSSTAYVRGVILIVPSPFVVASFATQRPSSRNGFSS